MNNHKGSMKRILLALGLGIFLIFNFIFDKFVEKKIFNWLVSILPDSPVVPWIIRGIYIVIWAVVLYFVYISKGESNQDDKKEE